MICPDVPSALASPGSTTWPRSVANNSTPTGLKDRDGCPFPGMSILDVRRPRSSILVMAMGPMQSTLA
ncbi:hypothetical protein VM1G_11398 [Cytospora mali]|uniref:Uncharacterized protein n=1 Tax=Cytospora mali TaxID=578113 RepID=A0A194VPI3_CYTMA|nr:hypothetical protein VM1G_11398 [Valsa mali]